VFYWLRLFSSYSLSFVSFDERLEDPFNPPGALQKKKETKIRIRCCRI